MQDVQLCRHCGHEHLECLLTSGHVPAADKTAALIKAHYNAITSPAPPVPANYPVTMLRPLCLLTLALATAQAAAPQPRDLLCDICIDVVTDLDEWITSDSEMADIINFVEGVSIDYRYLSTCSHLTK